MIPSDVTVSTVRSISEQRETHLFWHLRVKTAAAAARRMLETARLRLTLVAGLSLFFWAGLFVLFYKGFVLLSPLMQTDVVQALYNAFFLALMLMLVFSSGIILYSSLYCSPETTFLLTSPARPRRIYAHKFQEAVWLSSWGFVLLGSPTLVAYGVASEAPWHYFALLLPFVLAFVHIPAAIGGILCILIVNWLSRLRIHVLGISIALATACAVWFGWWMINSSEGDVMGTVWFREVFSRLRFTEHRVLPSWWLTAGLLEATRGSSGFNSSNQPWAQSLLFLSLLVSNALFFNLLGSWTADRLYRSSYGRLHGEQTARRRTTSWWIDRVIERSAVMFPREIRLLLVKDFRLFRRDPLQWSQFLIFFGLLGLYFINIRRFTYNMTYSTMIGFLNLAVVGLILSTFTTRFIFPMISLEGRQLWILGLLPIPRDSILWSKFLFASLGSLVPCSLLILLSDLMLQISGDLIALHQVSCLALCMGLSAIAVGLGAKMPDLRENAPSKIAAGFGGTLNLVISAAYIVFVVLLTALPMHLNLAAQHDSTPVITNPILRFWGTQAGVVCGLVLTLVGGTVATVWPLYMGLKAFRKLEI